MPTYTRIPREEYQDIEFLNLHRFPHLNLSPEDIELALEGPNRVIALVTKPEVNVMEFCFDESGDTPCIYLQPKLQPNDQYSFHLGRSYDEPGPYDPDDNNLRFRMGGQTFECKMHPAIMIQMTRDLIGLGYMEEAECLWMNEHGTITRGVEAYLERLVSEGKAVRNQEMACGG